MPDLVPILCLAAPCIVVRIVAGIAFAFPGFALVSGIGVGICGTVVGDLVGLSRVGALFLLAVSVAHTFSGIVVAPDPFVAFHTVADTAHTAVLGLADSGRLRLCRVGAPFLLAFFAPLLTAPRTCFGIAAVDAVLALASGSAPGIGDTVLVGHADSPRHRCLCRVGAPFLLAFFAPLRSAPRTCFGIAAVDAVLALASGSALRIGDTVLVGLADSPCHRRLCRVVAPFFLVLVVLEIAARIFSRIVAVVEGPASRRFPGTAHIVFVVPVGRQSPHAPFPFHAPSIAPRSAADTVAPVSVHALHVGTAPGTAGTPTYGFQGHDEG